MLTITIILDSDYGMAEANYDDTFDTVSSSLYTGTTCYKLLFTTISIITIIIIVCTKYNLSTSSTPKQLTFVVRLDLKLYPGWRNMLEAVSSIRFLFL